MKLLRYLLKTILIDCFKLRNKTIFTFSAPEGKDKIIIEIDGKVVQTIELVISD